MPPSSRVPKTSLGIFPLAYLGEYFRFLCERLPPAGPSFCDAPLLVLLPLSSLGIGPLKKEEEVVGDLGRWHARNGRVSGPPSSESLPISSHWDVSALPPPPNDYSSPLLHSFLFPTVAAESRGDRRGDQRKEKRRPILLAPTAVRRGVFRSLYTAVRVGLTLLPAGPIFFTPSPAGHISSLPLSFLPPRGRILSDVRPTGPRADLPR